MKLYKTNAEDVFERGDRNDGFEWGIEYYDANDNFVDIQWYRTAYERDKVFDEECIRR